MIRPVSPAEYPAALKVIGDAFSIVVRPPTVHTTVGEHPDGHFLAAERDGAIVGTGASVGFGPTGWIGGIAVAPAARGARLGQALTEAVIEALGPRETLLLLASDAGRPIYERLGFEVEERYRVFWSPAGVGPLTRTACGGSPPPTATRSPRSTRASPARRARSRSTAASRAPSPRRTSPPSPSARRGRRSRSCASNPDAGATLLRALVSPGLRLAVPESNAAAVETLRALGCTPGNDVVRMRRGAPVSWRPEELWGVFSLFFG